MRWSAPVSYTHLFCHLSMIRKKTSLAFWICVLKQRYMAVSYTHLDVYKRQEQAQAEDGNAPEVPLPEEENILTEYGELYLKNTDMVGWLSIAGTTLNYPVMQTPNCLLYTSQESLFFSMSILLYPLRVLYFL